MHKIEITSCINRGVNVNTKAPLFPLLPFLLPPSLPSLPLPFPPLRSRPNIAAKASGERLSSPPRVRARSLVDKRFLMHFRLFNGPLVTILWLKKTKNYGFYGILKWEVSPHPFLPPFLLSYSHLFPSFPLPSHPLFPSPSLKSSYGSGSAKLHQWGLGRLAKPQPKSNFDTI